ncbi:NosL protein [Pseudomonas sp. Choline-3u-10]|uniref:nitrous oxide reductase accessory protein NosL n=1 Tax=Pseudomonadaceae TaxID=135621 RepID=UPI000617C0BC|nr:MULTISPECIES: nitrous oxide reductase accessory protein NosL [Pseudomonadaceae]MAL37776.1 NosL protein [Pseudomonas sp.]KJJ61457.1 NosL protein [Pseudomonas sp. 10B238]MBK3796163.1 NosL protein [Stutzerimonas stutzeri]MBK3876666.1 NosL protein [Stutzerimonas stutzeri]PKG95857.1 NosL protein [Pseudomonas sp. Choline-3u-10]
MNALYRASRVLITAAMVLGLAGCNEAEQSEQLLEPVAFHSSDECHVCGMVISDFPGPKGQAVEKGGVRKFCSTAEMLGWWLQPENRMLNAKLYVHDMGRSTWEHPDDKFLIDATSAYYVAGTSLKGAMGVVLATFADESAAKGLAAMHGGRVLRFEDIDQSVLQQTSGMSHDMPGHQQAHAGH